MLTFQQITQLNQDRIKLLKPIVQDLANQLIDKCSKHPKNIVLLITSTLRTFQEQAQIYSSGRGSYEFGGITYTPHSSQILTTVEPGRSFHNFGLAFDFVPCEIIIPESLYHADYEVDYIDDIGLIGESLGLIWGGRWKKFPDNDHFQYSPNINIDTIYEKVIRQKMTLVADKIGEISFTS